MHCILSDTPCSDVAVCMQHPNRAAERPCHHEHAGHTHCAEHCTETASRPHFPRSTPTAPPSAALT